MNQLKRILGIVWIIMGPAAILFLIWQAYEKVGLANAKVTEALTEAAKEAAKGVALNTFLQWAIIIAVFVPIAFGFVIFGKYALQGEYDHLPESSKEIEDGV